MESAIHALSIIFFRNGHKSHIYYLVNIINTMYTSFMRVYSIKKIGRRD